MQRHFHATVVFCVQSYLWHDPRESRAQNAPLKHCRSVTQHSIHATIQHHSWSIARCLRRPAKASPKAFFRSRLEADGEGARTDAIFLVISCSSCRDCEQPWRWPEIRLTDWSTLCWSIIFLHLVLPSFDLAKCDTKCLELERDRDCWRCSRNITFN